MLKFYLEVCSLMLAWLLHRHLLLEGAPARKWHMDFAPWHLQRERGSSDFHLSDIYLNEMILSFLQCQLWAPAHYILGFFTLQTGPCWHQLCFMLLCSEPWDLLSWERLLPDPLCHDKTLLHRVAVSQPCVLEWFCGGYFLGLPAVLLKRHPNGLAYNNTS